MIIAMVITLPVLAAAAALAVLAAALSTPQAQESMRKGSEALVNGLEELGEQVADGARECAEAISQVFSEARPEKTHDDIEEGKQNNHKEGTNEHKQRAESKKKSDTSTWKDNQSADDLTLEAYEKGEITQTYPDGSPKEVKWEAGETVGGQGQTQITVKVKPNNGPIHGYPSGPRK